MPRDDWWMAPAPLIKPFDAESANYDYERARAAGLGPAGSDQHWGTVAPASPEDRARFGLPPESYVMLKGRKHPTWNLGEQAEVARGFKIIRLGDRYYSVPADFQPGANFP